MFENSASQFLRATNVIKPEMNDVVKSKPVMKLSKSEGVTEL